MELVFTGPAVIYGVHVTRDKLERAAKAAGYTVSPRINPWTKYLVTNKPDSGTVKAKAAKSWGVPAIEPEKLVAKYGLRLELDASDLFA